MRAKNILRFLLVTLTFLTVVMTAQYNNTSHAQGKIYIDVGKAQIKKSLLALPSFQYYGSKSDRKAIKAGQELFTVVSNDLNVSDFFTFIKPEAFLEDTSKVGLKPAPGSANGFKFEKWKTIGTEFLIRGGYHFVRGNIKLEVYLYYVPQAKLVFGKSYEGPDNALRKLAHTFADDVIENLTGKKGIFNTKIVVASDYGGTRHKGIWIMDWDGANKQKITHEKTVHISPAWSIDGKKIAYTAYAYHPKAKIRNADLFMYELETAKRWLLSFRKGINSGANFMPDGKHLLLTLSQEGNPDIFRMTLDGKNLTRITNGPNRAMNVEPAISPDGTMIAFSSDRGGKPMIYTMSSNGSNIKRITEAGRYNATPSWSPDSKRFVFAGFDKGHFDLFIVDRNGLNMERLTSAKKTNGKWADNESPTFSPDGRYIMFTSNRSGKHQLYLISPDGTNERRITFDNYNYTKPEWSPYLK
ncbi:MAG: Tol-Pal system beta propeller repeat protein TolB [Bdellovibrionales bacterium]|nr:Tol-Pal system beta propeller repeat protein TolB [Bdellovibrionales bacterium]